VLPTGAGAPLSVLVSGFLSSTLGLGEAARLLAERAAATGARVSTRDYRHLHSNEVAWRAPGSARPAPGGPDVAVLAVNGRETPRLARVLASDGCLGPATHRVGLWFWEGAELPDDQAQGLDHVDEIWVTSEFTAGAVRAAARRRGTDRPVHVVPLGGPAPEPGGTPLIRAGHRSHLGLLPGGPPGGLLVGCSFDLGSTMVRKNPAGLIEAWRLAFPTPDPTRRRTLVLKVQNSAHHRAALEELAGLAGRRPDIVLWDRDLSAADQRRFMASLDVFASLHRGEGYGLLLLEAMALGLPVIATGASGNLAFMAADTSWLVPARPVVLDRRVGSYPAGTSWFEPDVDAAAAMLREVCAGGPEVAARAAVDWLTRRFAEIATRPGTGAGGLRSGRTGR
jgi:glycosyltransferase involved in cell wall biosynthesis